MHGDLDGSALLGFAEHFEQASMLGAARLTKVLPKATTKPAAKSGPKAPPGRGKGVSPHKAALASVVNAATSAINAGKKGAAYVAAKPPAPKTLPGMAKRATAVGAAAAVAKLTPKQKIAVNKHTKAASASAAATLRLKQQAQRSAVTGKDAMAFAKKTVPYLKAKLSGKPTPARVGAVEFITACGGVENLTDDEVLGLAAMIGDEAVADAEIPMDAPLDAPLPPDTGAGAIIAPDGTVLYDPATDPNIVPIPARGGKLSQEDAKSTWQNVPDDGIVYDGSRGWPRYSKGSWLYFYGPKNANGGQFGMVWGYDHMNWPSSTETRWIKRYGQNPATGNDNWDDGFGDDKAAAAVQTDNRGLPAGSNYYALIGNPNSDLAGLQYAVAEDKWFWQSANAPKWATAEADAKIQQANAKTIAANRAAAQVQLAQMLKDQADLAAAQAAQEAENALAESRAQSEAAVAQTQMESQQAQLDVQSQQLALEQAKAEQAQQAAQAQLDLQAGQILLERARQMPMQPMPAPVMSEAYQDQGYYEDEGEQADEFGDMSGDYEEGE